MHPPDKLKAKIDDNLLLVALILHVQVVLYIVPHKANKCLNAAMALQGQQLGCYGVCECLVQEHKLICELTMMIIH